MIRYCYFIALICFLSSCSISKLSSLSHCEASFQSVSDAMVNDIKLQDGQRTRNLGIGEYIALSGALMNEKTIVKCKANITITNNGKSAAAIEKFSWEAYMGDSRVATDVYRGHFEVLPGKSEILTVPVTVSMRELLREDNAEALKSLASRFLKTAKISGLSIKVQPHVKFLFFYIKTPSKYEFSIDK